MDRYELILAVINAGFSDLVMDAARAVGAKGGTIVHARGTANREIEEKYGVVITPDKEIVMIVVSSRIKDNVLDTLYKAAGLQSEAKGFIFSLPIEDVVGLE